MGRTQKALLTAVFSYFQFAVAMASALALFPFILRTIGNQSYGIWLGVVEILGYAGLAELGVMATVPWLVAQHDGTNDRSGIRAVLSNCLILAFGLGTLYLLIGMSLWYWLPSAAGLAPELVRASNGPVLLVIVGIALGFPLRTFSVVLTGLQDSLFLGIVGLAQGVLSIILTVVLLWRGDGLYALATALALPPLAAYATCMIRVISKSPDLLRGCTSVVSCKYMAVVVRESMGAWIGGVGWRMVGASSSIVFLLVAGPEAAVVYACTSKLPGLLMQMSWILCDSTMIGLAQLSGEGNKDRVRDVTLAILRLSLVASSMAAIALLLLNGIFTTYWVGSDKFGGSVLNCVIAIGVVGLTFSHGIFVLASVTGHRLRVGWATAVQGVLHLAASLVLGYIFGATGVAGAAIISGFLIAIPTGSTVLRRCVNVSVRDLYNFVIIPWLWRAGPFLVLASAAGCTFVTHELWLISILFLTMIFVFLWATRSMYIGLLPLGRLVPYAVRLRSIVGLRTARPAVVE